MNLTIEMREDNGPIDNILSWDSGNEKAWMTTKAQDLREVEVFLKCVMFVMQWLSMMNDTQQKPLEPKP